MFPFTVCMSKIFAKISVTSFTHKKNGEIVTSFIPFGLQSWVTFDFPLLHTYYTIFKEHTQLKIISLLFNHLCHSIPTLFYLTTFHQPLFLLHCNLFFSISADK